MTGELTTLARPYAVAVYKRAKETGGAEGWQDALDFLSTVLEDERIAQAAANPKAKREDFAAAFLDLTQGHLDAEAQNFVRLLIENHRLNLVKDIAALFREYKAADEGYIEVDVSSAYPLKKAEANRLASALEKHLGKQARLNISVDRALIGGVYIRAGDQVIDASVRGQIERLSKRLWN